VTKGRNHVPTTLLLLLKSALSGLICIVPAGEEMLPLFTDKLHYKNTYVSMSVLIKKI
jgi:hypothetical protein